MANSITAATPDKERNPHPIQDGREDIPALIIGAHARKLSPVKALASIGMAV